MSFWEKAGDIFLKQRAAAAQAKDDIHRLVVHDIAVGQEMYRMHLAKGYGLPADAFRAPYGQSSNVTINNVGADAPAQVPAPTPAAVTPAPVTEPAKKTGGLLKTVAMTALMATGGGGLVAAGGYGAYSLLKEQLNKPVQIDPAAFKTKISWEPDKGLQVGELEPVK